MLCWSKVYEYRRKMDEKEIFVTGSSSSQSYTTESPDSNQQIYSGLVYYHAPIWVFYSARTDTSSFRTLPLKKLERYDTYRVNAFSNLGYSNFSNLGAKIIEDPRFIWTKQDSSDLRLSLFIISYQKPIHRVLVNTYINLRKTFAKLKSLDTEIQAAHNEYANTYDDILNETDISHYESITKINFITFKKNFEM